MSMADQYEALAKLLQPPDTKVSDQLDGLVDMAAL